MKYRLAYIHCIDQVIDVNCISVVDVNTYGVYTGCQASEVSPNDAILSRVVGIPSCLAEKRCKVRAHWPGEIDATPPSAAVTKSSIRPYDDRTL